MSVNTILVSGAIQSVDITNRNSKKGPSALVVIQYGPSRQKTDSLTQFVNVALVRLPPYVLAKCKNSLRKGCLVDMVGHTQGVVREMNGVPYVSNELVADRITVVDTIEDGQPGETDPDDEAPEATVIAAGVATPGTVSHELH